LSSPDRHRRLVWLTTALVTAWALFRAWQLRWVCDDAFVSFRYADHMVQGHGLVWNLGERVEGMTNLLWTLMVGAGMSLGAEPVLLSQLLGIVSLLALVGICLWITGRWSPAAWPVAAWLLLLMVDTQEWATGGLETMTFAALAVLVGGLLLAPERPTGRQEIGAGVAAGALFLIRPDGALIAAAFIAWYALLAWRERPLAMRRLLRPGVPFALIVIAATIWRMAYYGDPVPNTFYAKSASDGYWSAGLTYVGLLLVRYPAIPIAIVIGLAMAVRRDRRGAQLGRALGFAVAGVLFLAYVAHSGGDFMFARRALPAVPLLLLAAQPGFATIARAQRRALLIGGLALAVALPLPIFDWWGDEGIYIGDIAHEPGVYPASAMQTREEQGRALGAALEGVDTTLLLEGGMCILAYYSRLPSLIEGAGLTDRVIARQELDERGHIGHEKRAPEWYLRERGVSFVVLRTQNRPPPEFHTAVIGDELLRLRVYQYHPDVMNQLIGRPGLRFAPIESVLAALTPRAAAADCEGATRWLAVLDDYYFSVAAESADARRPFVAAVESACAEGG